MFERQLVVMYHYTTTCVQYSINVNDFLLKSCDIFLFVLLKTYIWAILEWDSSKGYPEYMF